MMIMIILSVIGFLIFCVLDYLLIKYTDSQMSPDEGWTKGKRFAAVIFAPVIPLMAFCCLILLFLCLVEKWNKPAKW